MDAIEVIGSYIGNVARELASPYTLLSFRVLIAGTFVVAGLHKLSHKQDAAESIALFQVTRAPSSRAASGIGLSEVLIGVALLAPMEFAYFGATAAVVASCIFVILTVTAVARGATFPCNCLSSQPDPLSKSTVVRAALMLTGSLIVIIDLASRGPSYALSDLVASLPIGAAIVGIPILAISIRRTVRATRSARAALDWEVILSERRNAKPADHAGRLPTLRATA